ncbi:hypothetical protein ISCGN_014363 [Ixodes scapularis]
MPNGDEARATYIDNPMGLYVGQAIWIRRFTGNRGRISSELLRKQRTRPWLITTQRGEGRHHDGQIRDRRPSQHGRPEVTSSPPVCEMDIAADPPVAQDAAAVGPANPPLGTRTSTRLRRSTQSYEASAYVGRSVVFGSVPVCRERPESRDQDRC